MENQTTTFLYVLIAIIVVYYITTRYVWYEDEQENFDPSLVPVSSIVTLAKVAQKLVDGNGTLTNPGNLTVAGNLTVSGNLVGVNSTTFGGANAATVLYPTITNAGTKNMYMYAPGGSIYIYAGTNNAGGAWNPVTVNVTGSLAVTGDVVPQGQSHGGSGTNHVYIGNVYGTSGVNADQGDLLLCSSKTNNVTIGGNGAPDTNLNVTGSINIPKGGISIPNNGITSSWANINVLYNTNILTGTSSLYAMNNYTDKTPSQIICKNILMKSGAGTPATILAPTDGGGLNVTNANGNLSALNVGSITTSSISSPTLPGAYMYDHATSAHPIFCSCKYINSMQSDVDDTYLVMPGYKLLIYPDEGYVGSYQTIDNTTGTSPIYTRADRVNSGGSWALFYNNTEVKIM